MVDAAAIANVVDVIVGKQASGPVVVVVSALGGATNVLLDLAHKAAGGELLSALQLVEQLRDRHLREMQALLDGSTEADELALEISASFDELAHLAEAFRTLGYLTPRSLDTVAALGELLSSQIVAAAFRHRGYPAVWVDARDVMKTNDLFTRAEPDVEAIACAAQAYLLPLLQQGKIPVMGGFVGSAPGRVTTTLGRGGSDYTASLIALGPIPVYMASLSATGINFTLVIDDEQVVPAMQRLHAAFFEQAS